MGWRKVVHRATGKCMGRSYTLARAEVRIEIWTDCDGEAPAGAELYKFGELVDEVREDVGGEVATKIIEWNDQHRP